MRNKLAVNDSETDSISFFHCRLSERAISGGAFSQFWVETLIVWRTLSMVHTEADNGTSAAAILSEVIWNNDVLKIEEKVGGYKSRLIKSGVCRVDDLYDTDNERLMTSNELIRKYNSGHFLVWQSILSSIPRGAKILFPVTYLT